MWIVTHTRLVMPARQPSAAKKPNVTMPLLALIEGLATLPSTVKVGSVLSRRVRLRMQFGAALLFFIYFIF